MTTKGAQVVRRSRKRERVRHAPVLGALCLLREALATTAWFAVVRAVVAVASVALFALGRSLSLSIGRSCAAGGAQRKAHSSGGGTTRRNASKSKSKSIVRQ